MSSFLLRGMHRWSDLGRSSWSLNCTAGAAASRTARRVELDCKTVRRYIAQGLEPPAYGPRQPRISQLRAFELYLRERLAAFLQLTG
jgi:hypothetical protein